MNVELSTQELSMVLELIDSRLSELHPEIRRCRDRQFRDSLKEQWMLLRELQQRLSTLAVEHAT